MSFWCHSNKFARYTKTFLNTWKLLKIHSIPNPHRNHKEKFSELDYFQKNDIVFIFVVESLGYLNCFPNMLHSVSDFHHC